MITITKRFTFEAAHDLPWHQGKCKRLHGHSYKLEIEVEASYNNGVNLNENGIVWDFDDLKAIVQQCVIDPLDHQYLNDRIENPTAENIAKWIRKELLSALPFFIKISSITLWETETCKVTIR